MQLGCVADDLTGASDLANELVRNGLRTIQTIGVPAGDVPPDVDAVVIALKSRSNPAAEAIADTLAALDWLRAAGCERVYFKYCSTFDSTARGNIGPVIAALAQAMGSGPAIACPAFPANRRTIYQGYLFVGDRLLNESGMEAHPLTPMTDANLVRVLQAQMTGPVGHIAHADVTGDRVAARMAEAAENGVAAMIADAVDDDDLARLGAYCATVPLSSGASGLGAGIARALAGAGAKPASARLPRRCGGRAVVAGSCSLATRRQVAVMAARYPAHRIRIEAGRDHAAILAEACAWIDRHDLVDPVLVYSTASPEIVAEQRAACGDDVSTQIEALLADVAAHLVARGVVALIVAGGETSGAVVQRLAVPSLLIGPEIDPGVPWTIGHHDGDRPLLLALKSGNFGSDDFMIKAWDLLQ